MDHKNETLLKEIDKSGHCDYVFSSKLGARKCERAKGHRGAHMFGVDKSLICWGLKEMEKMK